MAHIPSELRGDPCPSCHAYGTPRDTVPVTYGYPHRVGCEVGHMDRRYPAGSLVSNPRSAYVCDRDPNHQRDKPSAVSECPFCWAACAAG